MKRVLGRDNAEVDDGWLCDRGRYGFEMFGDEKRVDGPRLKGGAAASWEAAIEAAAAGLRAAGGARSRRSSATPPTRRATSSSACCARRSAPPTSTRAPPAAPAARRWSRLAQPGLSARVCDIDDADVILVLGTDPLHSSPILDLRIRKAIRRNGARLAVATERPTALDGGAEAIARYAPGEAAHFLAELAKALGGAGERRDAARRDPPRRRQGRRRLGRADRPRRRGRTDALLDVASALNIDTTDGSGLLEVPDFANARGLRESGCLPDAGPGLSVTEPGKPTEQIRAALESGELKSLILFGVDPIRDFPDTKAWEAAITAADFVVSFSMFETPPAPRPTSSSPWRPTPRKTAPSPTPTAASNVSALGLSSRRHPPQLASPREPSPQPGPRHRHHLPTLGLLRRSSRRSPSTPASTTPTIGGRGIRWQDTPASSAVPTPSENEAAGTPPNVLRNRHCPHLGRLTTSPADFRERRGYRPPRPPSHWAPTATSGPAPSRSSTHPSNSWPPQQRIELSLADAEKLGLKTGDTVKVAQNGSSLTAHVAIRERVTEGVCFLIEGTAEANANALLNGSPVNVQITKAGA